MTNHQTSIKDLILRPFLAATLGVLIGGLFTLLTGNSPGEAFRVLISAGFGCESSSNCALLTTLQYATPLMLSGLSAAVAFRAGLFSIGQAGQMILGAAAANWIASRFTIAPWIHPAAALAVAMTFGMAYALIPAVLKLYFQINEILSTILLNYIALYLVGFIPSGFGNWIPESARLSTIAYGTKLNVGFFIAIGIMIIVYLFLWRTSAGYEIRMSGQNRTFSKAGGIHTNRSIFLAMLVSGALAGIAGGIEVLGVHYKFVTNFTGLDEFDGVMVALIGISHPIGIFFSSILLGGVRLAAMTGLSIQMGIPRSIGGMMTAVMVIIMGADGIYTRIKTMFLCLYELSLNIRNKIKQRVGDKPTR